VIVTGPIYRRTSPWQYSLFSITQLTFQIPPLAAILVGVLVDGAMEEETDIQLPSPYYEDLSELNNNDPGDYIRLLRMLNIEGNTVLRILRVFSQQEAPPYAALSYCWGKEDPDTNAYFGR
jgi:hypothetical protein